MPDILDSIAKTNDLSYSRRSAVTSTNANLNIEDFYKLMSAQLKYQDPSNPTDSTDMLNQMTQMAMISSIENMNTMTQTTYAASMMGKEVTVAKVAEGTNKVIGEEKGIVTGVNLSGREMTVWVNGKEYKLSRVMQIGSKGNTSSGTETPNTVGNSNSNNPTVSGSTTTGSTSTGNTTTENTDKAATGESISYTPAVNTENPSEAIPPMTIISDKIKPVPTYDLKDNEGKIITPVG